MTLSLLPLIKEDILTGGHDEENLLASCSQKTREKTKGKIQGQDVTTFKSVLPANHFQLCSTSQ